jgi:ligand-binding sensor domain-containing protein/two-component sensor histidine kinase
VLGNEGLEKALQVLAVFLRLMRHLPHIFFLLLLMLLNPSAFAQDSRYLSEIYGTRDGLLSPKVYALAQTNNRQLWIGSELGLSIFDGYDFTNYQYTSSNEIIGRVLAIAEDSNGAVWIGGDRGLFYYSKGKIEKVTVTGKTNLAVESLLTDNSRNVWIGDLFALYRLSASDTKEFAGNSKTIKNLLPYAGFAKRAFSLAQDEEHNVYVAGFDALYKFTSGKNEYTELWQNTDPQNPIRSVVAVSPGQVYWTSFTGFPSQLINGKHTIPKNNIYLGRKIFKQNEKILALTANTVSEYVGDSLRTLFSYDSITHHAHTAIADAEGNIWLGTWEGLQKFRKTAFTPFRLPNLENTEVFSMLEQRNGDLLFGGNRGMVFKKTLDRIEPHPSIPALFPLAEVMCIHETKNGALWFGSGYQGIGRFENGKLTRYLPGGYLKDNNCEMLYPTADGNLLACTEQGVTVIDPQRADPFIQHYGFKEKFARYPELFGGFKTAASPQWFYGSQGLYKLENNELLADTIAGLPAIKLYINKIIADRKGNVWVATLGKGLLKCRINANRIELEVAFNQNNKLPSDNVLSVLADVNDNIWCADYMSLSLLQWANGRFDVTSFNEKDGLLSSYYPSLKLEQQRNGTIWALTTMGFLSFHPANINLNKLPPTLIINKIAATKRNSSEELLLNSQLAAELSWSDNNLHFTVGAICLTDPSKVRYAFRLLGADTNWYYTKVRNITYNYLRPGKYRLQVKACNNNGVWTAVPLEYQFSIRPPYWQAWWFIALIIAVVAAAIVWAFRRRMALVKVKAAVRQQMAELEAKAIRAQMNPHFIFNSLNAIQESVVMNDFDTSYQYLSKFSKLLRMVLDNSEKNMIPLRDEIEMNRLYLELESLRFRHSFHFSIEADDDIDVNSVLFPSIMVQPFIENAIWHGLLPKPGDKQVSVSYSSTGTEIVCTIDDNGIGRKKAEEIKKNKLGTQFFTSKAISLVRQRIEIFKQAGTVKANLEIIDKISENGEPLGTKVVVSIPVIDQNFSAL